MNQTLKHFLLIIFSFFLLSSTLFLSERANNKDEMKNVGFGYPLRFVRQDFSLVKGFSFFPNWMKFDFKNRKNLPITYFSPTKLFLDWLSFFIVLEILICFLESLDFWIRKKFFHVNE